MLLKVNQGPFKNWQTFTLYKYLNALQMSKALKMCTTSECTVTARIDISCHLPWESIWGKSQDFYIRSSSVEISSHFPENILLSVPDQRHRDNEKSFYRGMYLAGSNSAVSFVLHTCHWISHFWKLASANIIHPPMCSNEYESNHQLCISQFSTVYIRKDQLLQFW